MLDPALSSEFDIVPWNLNFETGIAIIDKQHQRLVELLNNLAHQYIYGLDLEETGRIIDALLDYADYHFETEEALWAATLSDDSWLAEHRRAHIGFVDKVRAMQSTLKMDDGFTATHELLPFITSWLAHHVLYEDKRCALVLQQVREGVDEDQAKQHALDTLADWTPDLVQLVLSMYKEISSRTIALERKTYANSITQQALLDQELHGQSVLDAASDNLWDVVFTTTDFTQEDQLPVEQFAQSGFTVHADDWLGVKQIFLTYLLGQSDVFFHQYRIIDEAGNERWIQSSGKIIEQGPSGYPKRMIGTQTDITERKTVEVRLQLERDARTFLSEFAADIMASSSEGFDAAINRALQRRGEYLQADRTYVFLVSADGNYINNTHEWCAAGIQPTLQDRQHIPASALPWWWSQLREVGYVLVPRVDDIPPEAQTEYEILRLENSRSVFVFPLYMGTELIGFIGNDAVSEERHWGTKMVEFMSLTSDLLGIALVHRQMHQKRAFAISQMERAEQQAHLGHWYIDNASGALIWSQEMFRIFEHEADRFTPDIETYFQLVHPDDRESIYQSYQIAKASLSELNLEHRILLDGARVKHLEVRGRFNVGPDGHAFIAEGTTQDVTERAQHRETLQRLAFQDPLTGLPNRRAAEDTLLREMDYCDRNDRRLVLAFLDLDNFREVNDQHGYIVGDSLLKALVQRMRLLFNDTAVIARVGGDEFVVLLTRLQPEESYFQQLNQLLLIISNPLTVDGIDLALTASVGITEYPQPIEVTREQLFRQAQQALFDAKTSGKNCLQKHDTGSEQDARVLTGRIEQIRHALQAGEFVLYYQPKVHMKTGIVVGVEALIRWRKSTGELVQPGEFLLFLYNHPLEVELGDWVIRATLAQMREWKQQGLDMQVSVNVSSQQLLDDSFVDKLSRELDDYPDISPSALQLEVLESSALNDLDAVSRVMEQSHQLGVSFALDDFGTGYSSLAHLKHLPISVLKIDQSFVREMMGNSDDLSIISAVVGMAKAFGLQVIAEGVESVEQGSLLLRLGCDQAQGYTIAKPMPADKVYNWVHSWKAEPAWQGQWPVDAYNLPLVYAEIEHRRWVVELEQWLRGQRNEVPVLDHHRSKVGLWIEREKQSRFGMHAKFNHLINLHCNMHDLGQKAVALHAKNDTKAALAALPEIWQLRDLFFAELTALIG
ncbi:MAG: bacteriohemerythrin [Pseudomonas sp.]|nr:bacteriohemerythrin [Pseudomonas sp.]